jgi:hypothetical protein
MAGKVRDENMFDLDMPFGEAMERFIGTSVKETQDNIARSKKKKPPAAKRKKRKATGGKKAEPKAQNIISMRERRMSLRRRGLA